MKYVTVDPNNAKDYMCVRIFGGLGNQMFQYAAALSQAIRTDTKLLLHVIGSDRLEHANFGLTAFPIDADFWKPEQNGGFSFVEKIVARAGRRKKQSALWPGARFQHESLTFSDGIGSVETGSYLVGYFQSEDYFLDHADLVRQHFSLSHLESDLDTDSRDLVRSPKSISVHIRRGDYLFDPKVLKIHGILEDDYYNGARALMEKMVPGCHFCIFSDDRAAAEALTQHWPNRHLMPEADRMHDLSLMSQCSHQLIANSSFSWWGAWLNTSPDRLVIAPRRWYSREHMQSTYIDDICPRGWILI